MRVRLMPGDRGGCGFYRMMEPGRVVADGDSDIEIEYCFQDEAENALVLTLYGPMGNERVVDVADPECDVVVLQRPAHRHLAEAIPHLQRYGTAVVCEYDDDFNTVDRRNRAWRAYDPDRSPNSNKIWAQLAADLADLVTVTTPALARRYGAHGRVQVIPNYVPASYLESVNQATPPLQLGWAGSPHSHPGDLQVMGDAVGVTLRSNPDTVFRALGADATITELRLPRHRAHVTEWAPLNEYSEILAASIDVGLVPLKDSAFNRAKSWLKGLEYASVGVPFVASPTEEYRRLAALGAGDLVNTHTASTRAWLQQINRLLEDDVYRKDRAEMGIAVARDLTYEGHADEWFRAWSHALTLRRAR